MAIISMGQYRVTAGRTEEAVKAFREARELHTGLGAKVRIWSLTAAGANSGIRAYAMEFADYRAYQDFIDKMQPHTPGPIQRAMESGVVTAVGHSMASEVV